MLTPRQFAVRAIQSHLSLMKWADGEAEPVGTVERTFAEVHAGIAYCYQKHGADYADATPATLGEVYKAIEEARAAEWSDWEERHGQDAMIAIELLSTELTIIDTYLQAIGA